jgi:hypothetical protein
MGTIARLILIAVVQAFVLLLKLTGQITVAWWVVLVPIEALVLIWALLFLVGISLAYRDWKPPRRQPAPYESRSAAFVEKEHYDG